MNSKVLSILEFDKIRDRLAEFASSPLGKDLCLTLTPNTDLDTIKKQQLETKDALSRLFKKDNISFGNNKLIVPSLKSLDIGATLSSLELLKIASFLDNVNRIKSYGRKEHTDLPDDSLTGYFEELQPLTQVCEEIKRCILSEDEICDDASSNLKHIRKSITTINDKIHSQLVSMVNGTYRTYLQDAVITL